MALSKNGIKLPAGVTRFVLALRALRALRVNYPLQHLRDSAAISEAQSTHAWFQRRVNGRGVRYYAEATYLFDE